MSDEIAIKVDGVSKSFKLPHERHSSIKGAIVNIGRTKRGFEKQHVLKDISFEIKKGEFFGIVGRNGSGKSTLLKLLAGIYTTDKGTVTINGKLTPFIELGVGFNPELSGRENVFLNGALLGFNRKEMEAMYDEIVEFAELERFMDQKLKNYSSGMQVRLAFSIAIRAQSDILVLDEVLAVGDADFQQKCYTYFEELKVKGQTVILVTHDMAAVSRFCSRSLYLSGGEISYIGSPNMAAEKYLEANYHIDKISDLTRENSHELKQKSLDAVINKVIIKNKKIYPNERIDVKIFFENSKKLPIHFGFQIFTQQDEYVFGTNTRVDGMDCIYDTHGIISISVNVDLVPGVYSIAVATMNKFASTTIDYRKDIQKIIVKRNDSGVGGIAYLGHSWDRG